MIGDDVEVQIISVRGDKVRLGITAPRQIEVHRKEIYLEKKGLSSPRVCSPENRPSEPKA